MFQKLTVLFKKYLKNLFDIIDLLSFNGIASLTQPLPIRSPHMSI